MRRLRLAARALLAPSLVAGCILAGCILAGCGASTVDLVAHVADFRSCEPIEVSLERDDHLVVESGCGEVGQFRCGHAGACEPYGEAAAPTVVPARVTEAVEAVRAQTAALEACATGADAVTVQIYFDATGTYLGARARGADPECVRDATNSARIASGVGPVVASVTLGAAAASPALDASSEEPAAALETEPMEPSSDLDAGSNEPASDEVASDETGAP